MAFTLQIRWIKICSFSLLKKYTKIKIYVKITDYMVDMLTRNESLVEVPEPSVIAYTHLRLYKPT